MSRSMVGFVTVVLTFIITRTAYWFFDYHPTLAHPILLGYGIDIAIWLGLCFVISWLLGKIAAPENAA